MKRTKRSANDQGPGAMPSGDSELDKVIFIAYCAIIELRLTMK